MNFWCSDIKYIVALYRGFALKWLQFHGTQTFDPYLCNALEGSKPRAPNSWKLLHSKETTPTSWNVSTPHQDTPQRNELAEQPYRSVLGRYRQGKVRSVLGRYRQGKVRSVLGRYRQGKVRSVLGRYRQGKVRSVLGSKGRSDLCWVAREGQICAG